LLSQIRLSSACPLCRLSVCLSVTLVTTLRRLNLSAIFLYRCVPYASFDLRAKFYGDHQRETPPSEERIRDSRIDQWCHGGCHIQYRKFYWPAIIAVINVQYSFRLPSHVISPITYAIKIRRLISKWRSKLQQYCIVISGTRITV